MGKVKDTLKYWEGNKLLAEFEGLTVIRKEEYKTSLHEGEGTEHFVILDHTRYHYDWSWLMPLADKIELLYNGKYLLQYGYDEREEFKGWYCTVFTLWPKDEILGGQDSKRFNTKIEAFYDTLVEMVEWHNKQKS